MEMIWDRFSIPSIPIASLQEYYQRMQNPLYCQCWDIQRVLYIRVHSFGIQDEKQSCRSPPQDLGTTKTLVSLQPGPYKLLACHPQFYKACRASQEQINHQCRVDNLIWLFLCEAFDLKTPEFGLRIVHLQLRQMFESSQELDP